MITVLLFFVIGSLLLFWSLKPIVGGKKVEGFVVASSIFALFGIIVALVIPKSFNYVKIGEHKVVKYRNRIVITDVGDTIRIDGTYSVIKDTAQCVLTYQKVETDDLINLFSIQPLKNHYIVKIKK